MMSFLLNLCCLMSALLISDSAISLSSDLIIASRRIDEETLEMPCSFHLSEIRCQ